MKTKEKKQQEKKFEHRGATCPNCGSDNYRGGGNMGGCCEDFGDTVGFHGSGNSIHKK